MKSIKAKVLEYLQQEDWNYEESDEKVIHTGIKGENCNYHLFFICEEKKNQMVLIGFQETAIPEQCRSKAAELLTRANLGLMVGSFIMDFDNGDYRFRIGINLEDGKLSSAMIRNYIAITYKMLDDMYPCIKKLNYSETDIDELYDEWIKN